MQGFNGRVLLVAPFYYLRIIIAMFLPCRYCILSIFLCLLLVSRFSSAQQNRVMIDAGQVTNRVPSTIYGSCIEDVNHEIYGGLYAQLIFGESFEEPSSGVDYRYWKKYTGYWAADREYSSGGISVIPGRGTRRMISGVEIGVEPDDYARLIYDPLTITNGTLLFDIRLPEVKGEAAGVVIRATSPGIGENAFKGYSIQLSPDGKKIFLAKHDHNRHLLQQASISINAAAWNQVKVALQNNLVKVFINGDPSPVIEYRDNESPLLQGKLGLCTTKSPAVFRQLLFINGTDTTALPLQNTAGAQVSDPWDVIATGKAVSEFSLVQQDAFHGLSAQTVELLQGQGKAGIANRSLNRWGIAVAAGEQFNGAVYLKCEGQPVKVTVALENADGTATYAKHIISLQSNTWNKYPFRLTSEATDPDARFALYIEDKGKIAVDYVSLFPSGDKLFKQLPVRADIARVLTGEKITFMRYGGSMVNAAAYRFKKMIGPRELRPPYTGHWNQFSSNGFGIEEFLQVCNAAGIEAAFAINIEELPEDAADMIEYLNGAATTVWGGKRAANGHPEPYGVKYIEIGNEEVLFRGDNANDYTHYTDRFNLLYTAIKAKDPSVKFIASAWWRPESPSIEKVFHALNGKAAYWDYHPWADDANSGRNIDKELSRMKELFHKWDPSTEMKCAIFEENGNLHNMQRALGHATTLNAVRRHGDFLLTSCPANALQPYGQNDNGWDQGQVFFTPTQVWGMPPYYAQQMAALHHLPLRVKESVTGTLDVTATTSENKDTLLLHVVNTGSTAIAAGIELKGFGNHARNIDSWTLAGPLQQANTPETPEQLFTKHAVVAIPGRPVFSYSFVPYSYTVLRLIKVKK